MRPALLLTHRAEKRRPRPLHDAPDPALAFRGRTCRAGAVVDAERMLEIAEVAVGLAMIAQRRAAGLDGIVQHRLDGVGDEMRAFGRRAAFGRNGRGTP